MLYVHRRLKCERSGSLVPESDVEMQVFRILILAQIGHDATGAMLGFDFRSHFANDIQQVIHQRYVVITEIGQRRNADLGDDHDMNLPVGPRVVKGQYAPGSHVRH